MVATTTTRPLPTTSTGPLTCTSSDGLTFTTTMESCEKAFAEGRDLAAELGLATQPDAPAAEQAVATTCQAIQGTIVQTYSTPETATLAERLNSSGVCPGSLDMLVPPTTAPAPVATALAESAGWTLVDVVDGETLDVVGADGQQLRVKLIGINAPAPGECMADQAVNVLRFIASGHELKLVPDVSDVDPNGLKLRYVEQVDGVDLGAEMIEQGVAVIETTEPDVARADEYAPVQEAAEAAKAGFWAPGTCPTATTAPP